VFRTEITKLPGVEKIILMDLSVAGGGAEPGFPVDLALRGRDWDQLAKSSELLKTKMKETGLMVDVDSNYASACRKCRSSRTAKPPPPAA
jgi:multidrug efflux pump subunit AcrB